MVFFTEIGYSLLVVVSFNPNSAAIPGSGIFGLPFREEDAALILLPVPWEVTTSYGGGTSEGPSAILKVSHQVDLYDLDVLKPYGPGIFLRQESDEVREWNREGKRLAQRVISAGGIQESPALKAVAEKVNALGNKLNRYVKEETQKILDHNKWVGVVGGDHSVPFGALQGISEKYSAFSILHFDAHSDTRDSYEGFTWSHASIMHNILTKIPQVKKMVQVGIRDCGESEMDFCRQQGSRVEIFSDSSFHQRKFSGQTFQSISCEIIKNLTKEVWVSFDIDGLDPSLCPHSGTPVPGGLTFQEANFILSQLVHSGRQIIGFDLSEVSPDPKGGEWDACVGARLLYKLCAWLFASHGRAEMLRNTLA